MPVITSPVKRFPGTVALPDHFTLPQVVDYETAGEKLIETVSSIPEGGRIAFTKTDEIKLPAILGIVSEWHIEGVPETPTIESFPLTPRHDAHNLVDWLMGEITRVYTGEIEIPNA